jgi:glutamyl-tRNA synthetase
MAKREGASAVADLRRAKVPPERVIGLLAHWSGLGDGSPTSAEALVTRFSLSLIPRPPVIVSERAIEQALGL